MSDDNFSSFLPTAKKPAPVRWQRPDGSTGELTVEELEQLKALLGCFRQAETDLIQHQGEPSPPRRPDPNVKPLKLTLRRE